MYIDKRYLNYVLKTLNTNPERAEKAFQVKTGGIFYGKSQRKKAG